MLVSPSYGIKAYQHKETRDFMSNTLTGRRNSRTQKVVLVIAFILLFLSASVTTSCQQLTGSLTSTIVTLAVIGGVAWWVADQAKETKTDVTISAGTGNIKIYNETIQEISVKINGVDRGIIAVSSFNLWNVGAGTHTVLINNSKTYSVTITALQDATIRIKSALL